MLTISECDYSTCTDAYMHVHVPSPLKHYNVFEDLERCQKKGTLCGFCLYPNLKMYMQSCTYLSCLYACCMGYLTMSVHIKHVMHC